MTPAQVRRQSQNIKSRLNHWNKKYKELQALCSHPNVSRTAGAHTDEYGSQIGWYWDCYCPDCDRHWRVG